MSTNGKTSVARRRVNRVEELMTAYKPKILAVLPKHLPADRIVELYLLAIRETPALLDCTETSLWAALFESAKLGLVPNNAFGHCYLIPYRDNQKGVTECQLQMGYQGFLELARRADQLKAIDVRAVYEGDEFSVELGTRPDIIHRPTGPDKSDKALTAVYAVARLANGEIQFDWMTRQEVDRIKSISKSGRNPKAPWNTFYAAMAKKTVIRRLCKVLPMNESIAAAVRLDEHAEGLDHGARLTSEAPQPEPVGSLSQLTDRLTGDDDVSPASKPEPAEYVDETGEIHDEPVDDVQDEPEPPKAAKPTKAASKTYSEPKKAAKSGYPTELLRMAFRSGVISEAEYSRIAQLSPEDQANEVHRIQETEPCE